MIKYNEYNQEEFDRLCDYYILDNEVYSEYYKDSLWDNIIDDNNK